MQLRVSYLKALVATLSVSAVLLAGASETLATRSETLANG